MFPFFKKKNGDEVIKTGKDTTISSAELIGDSQDIPEEDTVSTELSFHPKWKLSKEKEYVFRFLNNDLTPLKPNQISLAGVDLTQEDNSINVTAFLRNSLSKAIKIEKVEIILLDETKTILARKEFDLGELDEIPPKSSRPWMFIFEKETWETDEIPNEGWSLAFNIGSAQPHRLDLEQSWQDSLPAEEKEKLEKLVSTLPKLKKKEFNLMPIQTRMLEDGKITSTVLFRNGNPTSIKIKHLPLELVDGDQDIIAKGAFPMEDFEIKANTSKPWTFIFPAEMVNKQEPNFSKCIVRPIHKHKS
ncbi:accessory Sec system S-layer assembly protein [Rossellomorea sp. YZS02]|uniref:accessory Sec system S-layer assembly protein n=1 Tax=Rossellomorea sp. YZS02 TaxID=3097358 RepID=UPI002A0B9A57|nr:accessory Sec system S-layer assembly protein [Rossellomorea sp. YZS02]MDX8343186.1 accessory Sec system S-layer assembly protein [Rossellomorea sp. YZS02]